MKNFDSLTRACEEWFDKSLDDLPDELRRRVEKDFFPFGWDGLSAEQRRCFGLQWDYKNDPAMAERRSVEWQESVVDWDYWQKVPLLTAQEFCILRQVHDPRNFEVDRTSIPGGIGKTLGDRVSDDLRIIERSLGPEIKHPIKQWVKWAQQQAWDIPIYLRILVAEGDAEPAFDSLCQPVSAGLIRKNFPVIRDQDTNEKWWKEKMAEAERYGLLDCRVGEGKKGRGGGSLWRPDMIAGWLVDRHAKGKEGLSADSVRCGLKKFPGCEDIADRMFRQD